MDSIKSIENTLLLTHNPTPWHQNATIESFRFEDHYEDETWLKVFFVFDNCCFSFFVLFCFCFTRQRNFHVFTRKESTVIFIENKLSPLLITSNIWKLTSSRHPETRKWRRLSYRNRSRLKTKDLYQYSCRRQKLKCGQKSSFHEHYSIIQLFHTLIFG